MYPRQHDRHMLTPAQFAVEVGYCTETVRRFCRDGTVHAKVTPTGRYRIPMSEVDRFLNPPPPADMFGNKALTDEERAARAERIIAETFK